MSSNRKLRTEQSDGKLKKDPSSDDLKKYQECAKKLDECSKNLLRLCQYTNQVGGGFYDDEVERAANQILKSEEAEAKRIAEELRHQNGMLHRTQGSNRNLLDNSRGNLRETSRKELMYSGSSKNSPCADRQRGDTYGRGEYQRIVCGGSTSQSRPDGYGYDGFGYQSDAGKPICGEPSDSRRLNTSSQPYVGMSSGRPPHFEPHPCRDISKESATQPPAKAGTSQWRTQCPKPCDLNEGFRNDISTFRPCAESTRIGFTTGDSSTWPASRPNIMKAPSQTTQLTSTKCPIHIVITAGEDVLTQQVPTNKPEQLKPGGTMSDFETKFFQCVRHCWSLMNKQPGTIKDSNERQSAPTATGNQQSKSKLMEFCCSLPLSRERKRKDKRNRYRNKKSEDRCMVCTPIECPDGDGSIGAKGQKRKDVGKRRSSFEAECKKIFKEFQAYKKNKGQKQKETVSKGSDPDPCYEVFREINAMQDPCGEYLKTQGQPDPWWSSTPYYPAQGGWGFSGPQETNDPYGRTGANYSPGNRFGANPGGTPGYTAWGNQSLPQTLICTPISPSPTNSQTSSRSNLQESPSMDSSMLLAIARAAINLSIEQQKGGTSPRRDECNDSSDGDEGSSFCDILESIFTQ